MTNVSPVKKGNYFDMRLVSKTDIKRVVCDLQWKGVKNFVHTKHRNPL